MTDVVNPEPETDENPAWGGNTGRGELPTYPERPKNPFNHRFTISYDPTKPPFVVVRAETAAELTAAFDELEESGALAAMGNAWRALKAQAAVGAGLGPTTTVQAPQAPAQGFQAPPAQQFQTPATPPPFGPNVSAPQAPGFQGQQGFAPAGGQQWGGQQGAGQAARNAPKPRPNWPQVFRINVPQGQKDAFKTFREANKEILKGKVAWSGGGDYWIHGDVVQGFAQFSPVPA